MATSSNATARVTPFAALRFRDFRLLWFGQIVSTAGTTMRNVAVDYHVYTLAERSGAIQPALALGL
ncbi:MAG TPA: MFS transporter, partial [Roseiflexaceae bacterium]|nr:MFS transporter [Roseiflexaceae bacterium]